MDPALALIEYDSVAQGILAVDRMLKQSPIARLKCGTIHPGRYLALVGGTVASTEEAWQTGCGAGDVTDDVFLPDPHPDLVAALTAPTTPTLAEALAVLETTTSPALLRCVDAALKAVPVHLATLRLADDLGGRGLAILTGTLTDLQAALAIAEGAVGERGRVLGQSLLPRVDATLLDVVTEGTRFAGCRAWEPAGAEILNGEA
jgi:microcompartment protein CcmL/EutN